MSVAASTAVAIGMAAGTAGAGIYGAHKAGESADQANATTAASSAAAIEEQKRQDAQQKAQFDQQQAASKAQWDAEQQIRAPYRAAGQQALMRLGDLIGTHFDPSMMQTPAYRPPMPNAPLTNPQNPPPFLAPQTVKMGSLMPQQQGSGLMSPGARTIIDPTTGQTRVVGNA